MWLFPTIYPCLCPTHVVTFTLISNLATDYIQKRRGEPGRIKVKVTTWIGHLASKIIDARN